MCGPSCITAVGREAALFDCGTTFIESMLLYVAVAVPDTSRKHVIWADSWFGADSLARGSDPQGAQTFRSHVFVRLLDHMNHRVRSKTISNVIKWFHWFHCLYKCNRPLNMGPECLQTLEPRAFALLRIRQGWIGGRIPAIIDQPCRDLVHVSGGFPQIRAKHA